MNPDDKVSDLPKYPVNVPDPIGDLMNDLRTRGRARLIAGWFENADEIIVTAEISRQWDIEDPDVMHEELVVTLDTLETLLRWNRDPKKGSSVTDGKLSDAGDEFQNPQNGEHGKEHR